MKWMMKRWLLLLGMVTVLVGPLPAGEPILQILPSGSYFAPIMLDPVSNQLNASLLAFNLNGRFQRKVYIPVNMGVTKMIIRRERAPDHGWEAGFEFTIATQYEIHDEKSVVLGRLMNTDYRISGLVHIRAGRHTYRIRLFHKSSHLGDEYIFDSGTTRRGLNPLNYEQLDITRSTVVDGRRYYYGLGYNLSPVTDRERVAVQGGFFHSAALGASGEIRYLYGADVKIFEQNNYRPNVKFGLGLELWSTRANPPRLMVEYYNGYLPYSRLEHQLVQLLGLGLYFNASI